MGKEVKPILKTKQAFSLKNFFVKAGVWIGLFAIGIGSALGFVGCGPDVPIDSSSSWEPDVSETDTTLPDPKPPVEDQTSTQTPGEDESSSTKPDPKPPVEDETSSSTTQPDQKITYEEFIEDYKDIANNFALDQIETISYIKDSLSTSYTFKVSGDQITGMLVANVVKTGETERELKVANINFIPAIHVDDIANDTIPDNTAVTIVSDTKYSFDAKDEYIDQTTDIEDKLETIIKAELGDFASHEEQYIQESFAPETVADLVADYGDTVNEVMNKYFINKIAKGIVGNKYDLSKIQDAKWIFKGGDEISDVRFVFTYNGSETKSTQYVGKVTFSTPLKMEHILNPEQNIETLNNICDGMQSYSTFSFVYTTAEQGTRDALVNAIFEANGMSKECPEGATRLIVDKGYALDGDIGESNGFQLVQIEDNKITEFTIRIKQSDNDNDYISKLINSSNYQISGTNTIKIEGEFLDYTPVAETTALSSKTIAAEAKTTVVSNKKKQKTEENIRSL